MKAASQPFQPKEEELFSRFIYIKREIESQR